MQALPIVLGIRPQILSKGSLELGRFSTFRAFRLKICITVYKDAQLSIGNNVFINDGVNICASTDVSIGDNTKIGDMTYIYDTDFHPVGPDMEVRMKPVVIGKNVWIGAHSIILAGANIGDHTVIAAGSIVNGIIPEKTVAAGVPAEAMKAFETSDNWIRP